MKNVTSMQNKLQTVSVEIISSLLILLLVYTGTSKLLEQHQFSLVLSQSPLVGPNFKLVAWLLPLMELAIAILLFIPALRKWGFISSVALMSVFTFYIAFMILVTPHLPCSCGGVIAQMTWKQHLIFNCFFTTLAIGGLYIYQKNKLFIAINRRSRKPVKE